MKNPSLIDDIVSRIVEYTYFAFHVEEASDDGGKTIDIYMTDDGIELAQNELCKIFPKIRLIYYEMPEERIYELHDNIR